MIIIGSILLIIILSSIIFFLYHRTLPQFSIEITNPKYKALIGFEVWEGDEDNQYNTFKIHFVWIALRFDWK